MTSSLKGLEKYRRNWGIVRQKLLEYIPFMIITNLYVILIICVDGMIAGNFVGREAFSAIHIFHPVIVLMGAFTEVTAYGISTSISAAMGSNDTAEIAKIKSASVYITAVMAVLAGLIQVPLVIFIINSYHLSPQMQAMTWQSALYTLVPDINSGDFAASDLRENEGPDGPYNCGGPRKYCF